MLNPGYIFKVLGLSSVLTLAACISSQVNMNTAPVEIGQEPAVPGLKKVKKVLDKAEYLKLLDGGGEKNSARLVEIFTRNHNTDKSDQEYRILDVRPGSIYSYIGLKSYDVLALANSYPIPSQAGFWHFVNVMPQISNANIMIRREGVPVLVRYEFR